MGGWIASAKSCKTGFKSAPSDAAGIKRMNGFDVHNVNNMKPPLIRPITPSTRLEKLKGSCRLKAATATLQIDKIKIPSMSEPACAPHRPATLQNSGSIEFELRATYMTEKSSLSKQYT